ncbi:CBS domain-containing protein [Sphingomonas aracearum]|uniref:CBS domain-containing protein n=1 Tax=Sphingomonas aracearum TaxID=2283317 RepID=A0A369W242_9SPHN|nr:CBS domain-containing protein [Sphingomonas aracearum]RDE07430.1 CBS domain-containing protein [Sphingomonas aracearum]
MTIAAILKNKGGQVTSVPAEATVAQAIALLAEERIGAVPVMADGAIAGMFSERDVIRCLQSAGAAVLDRPVSDLMTSPAMSVEPGESVIGALALMTQRRIRHLPVLEAGRLVGIVSIGDLVKFRIDQIEADASALRNYIQGA